MHAGVGSRPLITGLARRCDTSPPHAHAIQREFIGRSCRLTLVQRGMTDPETRGSAMPGPGARTVGIRPEGLDLQTVSYAGPGSSGCSWVRPVLSGPRLRPRTGRKKGRTHRPGAPWTGASRVPRRTCTSYRTPPNCTRGRAARSGEAPGRHCRPAPHSSQPHSSPRPPGETGCEAVRRERRTEPHDSFISLARSLICYRRLKKTRS